MITPLSLEQKAAGWGLGFLALLLVCVVVAATQRPSELQELDEQRARYDKREGVRKVSTAPRWFKRLVRKWNEIDQKYHVR